MSRPTILPAKGMCNKRCTSVPMYEISNIRMICTKVVVNLSPYACDLSLLKFVQIVTTIFSDTCNYSLHLSIIKIHFSNIKHSLNLWKRYLKRNVKVPALTENSTLSLYSNFHKIDIIGTLLRSYPKRSLK